MNRGLIEAWSPIPRDTGAGTALPRFMNRGLIEALRSIPGNRSDDALPRFMNRGLIEATRATSKTPTTIRDFPDS